MKADSLSTRPYTPDVTFEWDGAKAATNLKKHGVEFREAATVFDDPLSSTFPDHQHSTSERRFLIIGPRPAGACSWWRTLRSAVQSESSVLERRHELNGSFMKKRNDTGDDLRAEYDFAAMKGGVRGKYYRRIREEGTNIVLLDPEIAEAFPSEASVNEALRGVLNTARAVRQTGGLPNRALQPTSRGKRKAGSKRRASAARG